MQVKQFTSGAEMIADYKARRERVNGWKPPEPPPEPFPVHLFVEPPMPIPVMSANGTKISHIREVVAAHYGVTPDEVNSARREAKIMRPRQVTYYLGKKLTNLSLPNIARQIGNRDHTTILSGIRKMNRLLESDEKFAAEVCMLEEKIRGVQ